MDEMREMKRETQARLRAYRSAHGLGCLARRDILVQPTSKNGEKNGLRATMWWPTRSLWRDKMNCFNCKAKAYCMAAAQPGSIMCSINKMRYCGTHADDEPPVPAMRPVQLDDTGAQAFTLAAEVSELRQKLKVAESRAEDAEVRFYCARKCVAALSYVLEAFDGNMKIETVIPVARRRLAEYKERCER